MYGHEIGDYQTAQTLETFGFLPKLSQEEVYAQISYILAQGWTPAIEHEHPSHQCHADRTDQDQPRKQLIPIDLSQFAVLNGHDGDPLTTAVKERKSPTTGPDYRQSGDKWLAAKVRYVH